MIYCDDDCNTCKYTGECELCVPFHETLTKLNSSISNVLFELCQVNVSIQHSLHNSRLNYPIYIGETLQSLQEHEKNLEEELYKLQKKRKDIIGLLKRRSKRK